MSIVTSETPAISPAPAAAPETAAVVDVAAAEAPPRPPVKAPENAEIATQTAVLPPEMKAPALPQPPIHLVGTDAPATSQGHDNNALAIEQLIAKFVGDRLPAAYSKGLMVEVALANSNAVTGENAAPNSHDIAIHFKGGLLDDASKAQELATLLRAAIQEHPAFSGLSFGGANTKIAHAMRCQILALEPARLQALLTPQPAKHITFVAPREEAPAAASTTAQAALDAATAGAHACSGAGCPNCSAAKEVAAASAATAPVEVPKPEVPKPDVAATVEPFAQQPVAAVKPEALQAPASEPGNQIVAPAIAQGMAANVPTLTRQA